MKVEHLLKQVLIYIFVCLTVLANIYSAYVDIEEIIKRSLGQYTIFSQRSQLTDRQAVLYCSFLAIFSIALLSVIGYKLYLNKSKSVVLYCAISWLYILLTMGIEQFFLS